MGCRAPRGAGSPQPPTLRGRRPHGAPPAPTRPSRPPRPRPSIPGGRGKGPLCTNLHAAPRAHLPAF
eukprot:1030838-Prymnesium_polylepis.1